MQTSKSDQEKELFGDYEDSLGGSLMSAWDQLGHRSAIVVATAVFCLVVAYLSLIGPAIR